MTMPANLVTRTSLILCIFLGVALQIQASIGIQTDYSGLRINLGDLALPFAGLFVLFTLAFKKSKMPRWNIPFGIFWPVLLTAIMTFALFHGRVELGEWSHWALLNKYTGWMVLMAYFGLGAWLVTNTGNPPARLFLKSFIVSFLFIALAGMTILIYRDLFQAEALPVLNRQLRGLMTNRNAYAFIILIVLSFLAVSRLSGQQFLQGLIYPAFFIFLPLILVYNSSRIAVGATVILLFMLPVFFGLKTFKLIFPPFLLGLLIIAGLYCVNERLVFREKQNIYMAGLVDVAKANNLTYDGYKERIGNKSTGDVVRLRVLRDALDLWRQHPIIGTGLGTFLHYQKEKYKDSEKPVLDIIDSTPLWLLTETGIIGLSAFLSFYGFILLTCWKNRKMVNDDLDTLRLSLLLILIGFAIMSLFHELLYSRHLWFMMGMALAVPKKHQA
ncbi:MAG: O-antigen ligase family protein [Micavibrio sp.]